jgi:hypothetical protein
VSLNESWGKTKVDTSVSKLGLRRVHVDFGLMLLKNVKINRVQVGGYTPLGEERKHEVLAFLGEPCLAVDEKVDLIEICVEDLGGKVGNKVLGKDAVVSLHSSWELRGVAKPEL